MRKQAKNKMVLVELKVRYIVSLLLALICDHNKVYEDFPLLRNFAGGWPIHALIQQYLKNTTEQARKAALRQASRAGAIPAAISNVPVRPASHHVQALASAVQIKTPSSRNTSSESTQHISIVKSNSSKKKSTAAPDATAVELPAKVVLILFWVFITLHGCQENVQRLSEPRTNSRQTPTLSVMSPLPKSKFYLPIIHLITSITISGQIF
jgi:hypothetical protein